MTEHIAPISAYFKTKIVIQKANNQTIDTFAQVTPLEKSKTYRNYSATRFGYTVQSENFLFVLRRIPGICRQDKILYNDMILIIQHIHAISRLGRIIEIIASKQITKMSNNAAIL